MNFIKKYFNNFLAILAVTSILFGCESERSYKDVRQQVIEIHNEVMADGETAERYRIMLDSLARIQLPINSKNQLQKDTINQQKKIALLINKLTKADQHMIDWMQRFQPDIEGKTNSEAIKYFEDEKIKIKKLDFEYQEALKESHAFLKSLNIEGLDKILNHDHSKH